MYLYYVSLRFAFLFLFCCCLNICVALAIFVMLAMFALLALLFFVVCCLLFQMKDKSPNVEANTYDCNDRNLHKQNSSYDSACTCSCKTCTPLQFLLLQSTINKLKHSQMLRQTHTISKKRFETKSSSCDVAHGQLHHLLQILSWFGVNRLG